MIKRQSIEDESNIIKQPNKLTYTLLGLSLFLILFILVVVLFPNYINVGEDLFLSILLLFNLSLYFYLLIWKVEVFDSYFTYRTIFGFKKYLYNNIEVRSSGSGYRFYDNNKHLLSISYIQDNYKKLSDEIKKYQNNNKIKIKKTDKNTLKPIKLL